MTNSRSKTINSWLFMAADDLDAIAEAAKAGPTVIVLDLEEFTEKEHKKLACEQFQQAAAICQQHKVACAIRIDTLSNGGAEQLLLLGKAKPYALFLPQVEAPEHLLLLSEEMAQCGLASTPIVPTIESHTGITNLEAILASPVNILAALLGTGDLSKSLGLSEEPARMEMLRPQREFFLATCIEHSIVAIDGPWPDLSESKNNKSDYETDLAFSYQSGFHSKCIIDIKQIPK